MLNKVGAFWTTGGQPGQTLTIFLAFSYKIHIERE